ncbi:hypothetical protein DCS_00864 [Drechmeria coniospora]|uniref:Ubiquitin family protein n=1 Tax=Drechmeria coniospora TaxID=98403 RepID=A0A151GRL4_DRECN|nr:hypothetical protein DCS_00864 [Drechmeria coniospora]KYK59730.1 hypothetical protein DCS_00864 [Drechmeria coniospora]ODA78536.1 hypothetical protein RJ55_05917 [Drechmeria coniospora]
MATTPSNTLAEDAPNEPPEQLIVNLQVISPSVGVNRPLVFPGLPATTTVKELKDKIRKTLPLQPSDDHQRLIHRGRALLRDSDNLLDIFGPDALRSPERQTIHLVIRDLADSSSSTPPGVPAGVSSARGNARQPTGSPQPSQPSQPPPNLHGPVPPPDSTTGTPPQPQIPPFAPGHHHTAHTPEQAAALHHHQQTLNNWVGHLQRSARQHEAMVRALVDQNQRERAQMGARGVGDAAGNNGGGNGPEAANGQVHHHHHHQPHTVHVQTFGPAGHAIQVNTVVRPAPATNDSHGVLTAAEVQNMIREADASQATMAMSNAAQATAAGPSPPSVPLARPDAPTPVPALGTGTSLTDGQRVIAHPELAQPAGAATTATNLIGSSSPPRQSPQVYIMMSPEGPRALLFNGTASESYFSPRLGMQTNLPRLRVSASMANVASATESHGHHTHQPPEERYQAANGHAAAAYAAPVQAPQAPQQAHPNNPPAAGIPPLLMHLWPHAWLLLRLGLFVWFFTSADSSWSRWLTIVCLAICIFIVSTGLFNGMAENAWRPIGRHLGNILPALERPGRRRDQRVPPPAGGEGNLTPAQMAARLAAERQAREGWLTGQIRRLERAGLLFLASIAPGVAERHIANVEAEQQAERNRQREAEAAAAAAAEAEAAASAAAGGNEASVGLTPHPSANEVSGEGLQSREKHEAGPAQNAPSNGVSREEPIAS